MCTLICAHYALLDGSARVDIARPETRHPPPVNSSFNSLRNPIVQSPEALDDQSPDPEHDPGSVFPWQREYAAFISAYNAKIKEEGLPLEAWRAF